MGQATNNSLTHKNKVVTIDITGHNSIFLK